MKGLSLFDLTQVFLLTLFFKGKSLPRISRDSLNKNKIPSRKTNAFLKQCTEMEYSLNSFHKII